MRIMRTVLLINLVCLSACLSAGLTDNRDLGTKYKYTYKLTEPSSFDTSWSDENVRIIFTVTDMSIKFDLTNLTTETMTIIWDESSFVQFGKAQRIMHKGIKLSERSQSQPPTIIPPRGSIGDVIIPVDNVSWQEVWDSRHGIVSGRWEKMDLLPTRDRGKDEIKNIILTSEGQKLTIFLPIEFGGKKKIYSFIFEVTDVMPVKE